MFHIIRKYKGASSDFKADPRYSRSAFDPRLQLERGLAGGGENKNILGNAVDGCCCSSGLADFVGQEKSDSKSSRADERVPARGGHLYLLECLHPDK